MRTVIAVIAIGFGVLLTLFGLLWFFQGIGVAPGTFMRNNTTWVIIGPITALIGIAIAVFGWRARRP
jgi:hypothetical protein